ncbi:MAG TPA: hypothetical protein VJ343_00735 [archaeon]|nr:hypothetical protein [archaeon]
MKRILILLAAFLVISIVSVSVMALQNAVKIKTIGALGRGLAISPSDPKDFKVLKVGVAKVSVNQTGNVTELAVGILHLDNETYRIKDVAIGNGTISGNIYRNDTQVGSFNAESVIKGSSEIWVGTLTLNGETWNIYVLGAPRLFKIEEMAEKISDYCEDNPDKCTDVAKGIGSAYCEKTPEDPSCREKIRNWCQEHSTDQRCLSLLRNFCKFNIEDGRCREVMKDYCVNNTDDEKCKFFELAVTEEYCLKHPLDRKCLELARERLVEYCLNHPNEQKCVRLQNATDFIGRVRTAMTCRMNSTSEDCSDFCESHPIACRNPLSSAVE